MKTKRKSDLSLHLHWPTGNSHKSRVFIKSICIFAAAALSILVTTNSPAQGLENSIPRNQTPVQRVFPPALVEQSKPGVGKFVIFSREQVGEGWDFTAGAWECIPSAPDTPITKRVEFCHSSWNASPLLDVLVDDDSEGMHPRFVRLQVDSADRPYTVNLYDINYRTWDVRCISQGNRLGGFGVMGDSIFCRSPESWFLLDASSGKLSQEIPFTPIETDGDFWLVRKPGETEGYWSYDRKSRNYIAHFGRVDSSSHFSRSKLSPDGKSRAWVMASAPRGWRSGSLPGRLIFQRNGHTDDVSVPIEIQAFAGSGVRVIPQGVELTFLPEDGFQLRAQRAGRQAEDRIWSIDIATGKLTWGSAPHPETDQEPPVVFDGVPVPDYLRRDVGKFYHWGRSGLAPAFLLHLGILKEEPAHGDGTAAVSPDGRHVFYRAAEGPLSGVYIYGDLLTKQTVRWDSPVGLGSRAAQEFVWVETPE